MIKLNPIFKDEMILQAKKPVRIYGEGDGEVTVTIGSDTVKTVSKNGKWLAELTPHNYAEILDIKISSKQRIIKF